MGLVIALNINTHQQSSKGLRTWSEPVCGDISVWVVVIEMHDKVRLKNNHNIPPLSCSSHVVSVASPPLLARCMLGMHIEWPSDARTQ